MKRLAISMAVVVFLACSSASGSTTPGTHPAGAASQRALPPESWIVYGPISGGGFNDLGLVHPEGSGDHRIPNAPNGNRAHPDWSPDGKQIVFDSNTPGTDVSQIYIVDPDGSHQRLLRPCSDACLGNGGPAWSPDGSTISYDANDGGVCYLGLFDLATNTERRVLKHPGCEPADDYARWSPDGRHIVFNRVSAGQQAIFTARVDGSHERELTDWGSGARPDWSPNGGLIAFMSEEEPEAGGPEPSIGIFLVRPNGSGLQRLTTPPSGARDVYPRWLPDGSGLIFSRCTGQHRCEIRTVLLDGSGHRLPIRTDDRGVVHPIWQPMPSR